MKKTLLTLFTVLAVLSAKGQKSDTLKGLAADTLVFTAVQKSPEFPGGQKAFSRYLRHTLRYPGDSRQKNIQGRVILSMIVEKDGALTHFKIRKGVADDIDKEALRVMQLCPKWNPGIQNGKPVRVVYTQPLDFALLN
jgi:protein TonB